MSNWWKELEYEGVVCTYCSLEISKGTGIEINFTPRAIPAIKLNYHKQCFRLMADITTRRTVIDMEQVAPNVYGTAGTAYVPPARSQPEPPKFTGKIPPKKKPI